jgi:hypothetical protein
VMPLPVAVPEFQSFAEQLPTQPRPMATPSARLRPFTLSVSGVDAVAPAAAPRRPTVTVADAGREHAPEVVLAAPIEMWFGEHRVGVRAGSATFDRFRKYADVLLRDLNDSR